MIRVFRPTRAFTLLLAMALGSALSQPACPEWTDIHTKTVEVGPTGDLAGAIRNAASGTTILLLPGTYKVASTLQFVRDDVTLRSKSGKRDEVILDGNTGATPLNPASFVNELAAIAASGVTLADITIRHARYHGVHAYPPKERPIARVLLRNIHINDCGEQLIKINSNGSTPLYWVDSGAVECSHIGFQDNSVMEPQGDGFYTGGIDMHGGRGWIIRNNLFKNIQRQNRLMEHGVHLWSKSRGCVIENNRFEDVYRAIGLGMKTAATTQERKYPDGRGDAPYFDFLEGVVRNNMIFNRTGIHLESGIELMNVLDVEIYHNTVYSQDPPFSSIEYRWPNTRITLSNNIAGHGIMARDGAVAVSSANLSNAGATPFANAAAGDLHLSSSASAAIDKGVKLPAGKADRDFDMDARDAAPDIGADEFRSSSTPAGGQGKKPAKGKKAPGFKAGSALFEKAADPGAFYWANGAFIDLPAY